MPGTITSPAEAGAVWDDAVQLAGQVLRAATSATVVDSVLAGALAERILALAQFEAEQNAGDEEGTPA